MEKVYFYSNKELIAFCEGLFRKEDSINIQWKTDKYLGNELLLIDPNIQFDTLIHCFIHVFMTFRLTDTIESIIKNEYYYTNEDEIDRIIELTNWIMDESDLNEENSYSEMVKQLLYDLFRRHVSYDSSVHFDSLVTFRMNLFKKYLTDIVGLAIDEFKREEEHQSFIQSIRDYVRKYRPKCAEIHLIQANPFLFFNEEGDQYTRKKLRTIMKQEPLYIIGLDHNEFNLAPLLALLPEKIYVYGRDPTEPRTQSIVNIFEERVIFRSMKKFPFKQRNDKG